MPVCVVKLCKNNTTRNKKDTICCTMWKRPASVPVGRVWMRFKGRQRQGEPAREYQIRDMEEPHREACINMMARTFLKDEPLSQVLDVKSDPVSVAEIRSNWERMLEQRVSLVCFEETDGEPTELVGFNVLTVKTKDDPEEEMDVKGEPWKKLLTTLITVEKLVDVFHHYGVDTYLTSSGLTIAPHHRGQNIGARIIEARKELCKAFNIRAVATVFTATTSQVLAAKCNYDVLATFDYSNMMQHGIDLTGCSTPCALYMGTKFQMETDV